MPGNTLPVHSLSCLDEPQRLSVGPHRRTQPWHPKLTPYRLAVLSTTFTLGTAKAIATQQGKSLVSITLEWVGGTVLSVMCVMCLLIGDPAIYCPIHLLRSNHRFFCLGVYESNERVPMRLHWFFKTDCMDILWNVLASLSSLQRPDYCSDETPEPQNFAHVAVTSYRTVVSVTIILFGVSKALMGYCGLSTSVTWVDWAIGTPITCIFYAMGLYENRPGARWSAFFSVDRSAIVNAVNFRLFILVASLGWIALASQVIHRVSSWDLGSLQSLEMDTRLPQIVESWGRLSSESLEYCLKLLFLEFLFGAVGIGVLSLYFLFYLTFLDLLTCPRFAQRISYVLQCPGVVKCWSIIKSTSRILAHLSFHSYALAFVVTLSMICLGISPYLFDQRWDFTLLLTGPIMLFAFLLLLAVVIGIIVSMIINFPR